MNQNFFWSICKKNFRNKLVIKNKFSLLDRRGKSMCYSESPKVRRLWFGHCTLEPFSPKKLVNVNWLPTYAKRMQKYLTEGALEQQDTRTKIRGQYLTNPMFEVGFFWGWNTYTVGSKALASFLQSIGTMGRPIKSNFGNQHLVTQFFLQSSEFDIGVLI